MAKLRLDIVTAERTVYSEDVDVVVAPGFEGELGILPRHAPLMTTLQPGELRVRVGAEDVHMAIGGGFMEVVGNHIIILADTAEHVEEIDAARAEAARQRAMGLLSHAKEASAEELAAAATALRRSQVRLKVARRKRQEPSPHRG